MSNNRQTAKRTKMQRAKKLFYYIDKLGIQFIPGPTPGV